LIKNQRRDNRAIIFGPNEINRQSFWLKNSAWFREQFFGRNNVETVFVQEPGELIDNVVDTDLEPKQKSRKINLEIVNVKDLVDRARKNVLGKTSGRTSELYFYLSNNYFVLVCMFDVD